MDQTQKGHCLGCSDPSDTLPWTRSSETDVHWSEAHIRKSSGSGRFYVGAGEGQKIRIQVSEESRSQLEQGMEVDDH